MIRRALQETAQRVRGGGRRYVAGRRLKMPGGHYVERGDAIDGAVVKGWNNLQAWINSGDVVVVEDEPGTAVELSSR